MSARVCKEPFVCPLRKHYDLMEVVLCLAIKKEKNEAVTCLLFYVNLIETS